MADEEREEMMVMIGLPINQVKAMQSINEIALVATIAALSEADDATDLKRVRESLAVMLKMKASLADAVKAGEEAGATAAADRVIAKAAKQEKSQ